MIGLMRSDEFHFVVTTSYPSAFRHVLNSLRCVVLPDPSGPSKATRKPRRCDGSVKCARASRRTCRREAVTVAEVMWCRLKAAQCTTAERQEGRKAGRQKGRKAGR